MMTHTPGPWEFGGRSAFGSPLIFGTGQLIAVLPVGDEDPRIDANAALIAAAPELLRECARASRQLKAIAAAANSLPQHYAAEIYQAMDVGWESIDKIIAKTEPTS